MKIYSKEICDKQANLQKEEAIRMKIELKNRETTPFTQPQNPPDRTFWSDHLPVQYSL